MYCTNCGRELRDGEICSCQKGIVETKGMQSMPYPAPWVPGSTDPATPAVGVLRRHGASSLMLTILTLTGLNLFILCVAFGLAIGSGSQISAEQYLYHTAILSVSEVIRQILLFSIFLTIAFVVPIFLGFLFFYLGCRRPKTPFVPTGGLTAIQVMCIIQFSFACLELLLVLIYFCLLSVITSAVSSFAGDIGKEAQATMSVVMGVGVVFVLLILALSIIFFVCLMRTFGAIKRTARTGQPDGRVSMFVIVMFFIGGILGLLYTLVFLGILLALPSWSYSGFVSPVVLGVFFLTVPANSLITLLLGILLVKYRADINKLIYAAQHAGSITYGNGMAGPTASEYSVPVIPAGETMDSHGSVPASCAEEKTAEEQQK